MQQNNFHKQKIKINPKALITEANCKTYNVYKKENK